MKTLKFDITINASAEKVWSKLWNDVSYRKWSAVFYEGSYVETDWKQGSKVKFMAPSGDGMFSKIKNIEPNKKMTFEHLGSIMDGKEIPSEWAGAIEEYILNEKNGKTILNVSVDIVEKYEDYFQKTFPLALQKIKELAEKK